MSAAGLAVRLDLPVHEAGELLRLHRLTYKKFWKYSEEVVTTAMFSGKMETMFGWRYIVTASSKLRTLMNFPMQANGAEMMRLAAIAMTRAGVAVCAPIHDAFLIEAPLDQLDDIVVTTKSLMEKAGALVTGGLTVKTDEKVILPGAHYMDEKGVEMWRRVNRLLGVEP
jgi:DNA polymerase I-like protein with 3'-5' exonuclease and polymerase domains